MLDELTPEQFAEWIAFDELVGVGSRRDDRRAAVMTAAQIGAWGGEVTPADLLAVLDPDEAAEETSTDATRANLLTVFRVQQ